MTILQRWFCGQLPSDLRWAGRRTRWLLAGMLAGAAVAQTNSTPCPFTTLAGSPQGNGDADGEGQDARFNERPGDPEHCRCQRPG